MSFAQEWAEELKRYGRVGSIRKPERSVAPGCRNLITTTTVLAEGVTALVLSLPPSESLLDVSIGKTTVVAKFFAVAGVGGIQDGCLWIEGIEPGQKTWILRNVEEIADEGETITIGRLEEKR